MSVSGVHAEPARDIVQYRAESIRKERKNNPEIIYFNLAVNSFATIAG